MSEVGEKTAVKMFERDLASSAELSVPKPLLWSWNPAP